MSIKEVIAEVQTMRKFNYTLAPDEAFEIILKALEHLESEE
jgi:hypothetical protein